MGTEYAGCVCPNNPYRKYAAQHEELSQAASLLEEAYYIGDLVSLGQLPKDPSPEEFMIARIMFNHARGEEMRMKAEMSMLGGSDG